MKNNLGFTLVELLIAIAGISIISVIAIRVLFDTVQTKSAEAAISGSNQELRGIINTLTRSVQTATRISIPDNTTLQIKGSPCLTLKKTGTQLEIAFDSISNCVPPPPTAVFTPLTSSQLTLNTFILSPVSPTANFVNLFLEGTFVDNLGLHPFQYQTTIYPRTNL